MIEFAPKDNREKDNKKEITESQKIDLFRFSRDITKHDPNSLEFFKLKSSFEKSKPAFKEGIEKFIKLCKESDLGFILDSEYETYFKLSYKLDLLDKEDKELYFEVFRIGNHSMNHWLAERILEEREFYKNKDKNKNEKLEEVGEEQQKQEENLPEFILEKLGFSEKEIEILIKSWLSVQDNELAKWYVLQSFQNINSLENFEKGSAKYLFDNFGIRGFGRYHFRELREQYEERENVGPYGVYFQAVFDWNGSFVNSNQSEDLGEKVREESFLLRIIEADGKIDLAKRLLFLRDKYQQKIKFMYMHVHGNTDVLGLGDAEGSNRSLFQKDFEGKGVQKIKDLFEDDAEVVLSSCLSGVKGGLAEEMANTYGVKVVAADKPTTNEPLSLNIEKTANGNNLKFNVVFDTVDMEGEEWQKRKDEFKGTVIYNPKDER